MKFKNFKNIFDFLISFSSSYLILTFSILEKSLMPWVLQNIVSDVYFKLFLASVISFSFLILNKIINKILNFQKYNHLFEFLVFTTIIFSTFYMLRLFSLSRLYIIISLFIFLILNSIYKNDLFEAIGQNRNIVFLTIFLIFFSYLTLLNINALNEEVINDIDDELVTTEDNASFGSELDMYYEIENNYKKHINTYVGTYDLNNTYSLKKIKICCEEYSYFEYSQKSSGAISFTDENLYHVSGNLIIQKFALDEIFDSTTNFSSYIVPTNINSLIKNKNIFENNWESLKDMFIFDNTMFLSYLEENSEDCINVQIISADISSEPLLFKPVFNNDQCVFRTDENYNAHQGGGKMLSLDKNHILLSVGDFRQYELSQNIDSIFGKILRIDIRDGEYEIISIGNRNPQGLSRLKNNDKYILETEHGPKGGDEINIISLEKVNNYGWPISSYGNHYDGKVKESAPLHKSHNDYGFEEPIHYFPFEIVRSHGISDVEQNHYIENNNYFVSTLNGRKLYDISISDNLKSITSISEIAIGERIRNIIYNDDNDAYILLLEDTPSIAVLSKKE